MTTIETARHLNRMATLPAFLAILFACTAANAATAVSVRADRTSARTGETISLDIVLEGEFDEVRGPDMPDFQVVGRSSGSSISIVNGSVSRQQRITLALAPARSGDLAIGKVELIRDGRVVASSNPIKIRIIEDDAFPAVPDNEPRADETAGQEPNNTETAREQATGQTEATRQGGITIPRNLAGKQAFIIARLPDRPVYAGEPIYLEYVLYTRSDVPIAGLVLNKAPDLKGFIIDNHNDSADTVRPLAIEGRRYEERVLWQAAVTAIDPGRLVVDPIKVDLVTGGMFSTRRLTVSSEPVEMNFTELPVEGRPADFIPGTIGDYIVSASLDKPLVKVGESAILTVEIAGSGNLRALKPPKIADREGVRVDRVPSSDLDEMRIDRGGISGRKIFQFLLTPSVEGSFDLGRIDVPYFSSATGHYERARSDRIQLTAAGFSVGGAVIQARRETPALGIIGESDLQPPPATGDEEIDAALLAALMAAPVLFFAASETVFRRRARLRSSHRLIAGRKALKKAATSLARLRKHPPAGQEYWNELDSTVRVFLEERFGLRATSMTPSELATALASAGAGQSLITELSNELEAFAFARFAPSSAMDGDRLQAAERIHNCLVALDRTIGGMPE